MKEWKCRRCGSTLDRPMKYLVVYNEKNVVTKCCDLCAPCFSYIDGLLKPMKEPEGDNQVYKD